MHESDGGSRGGNRWWEHDCPDCAEPLCACDSCGRPYCSWCQHHVVIERRAVAESHSASDVASSIGALSNPADETGLRFGKVFEEEYQKYWYRRQRGATRLKQRGTTSLGQSATGRRHHQTSETSG